ncbi:MAG: hypothetical protein ABI600_00825 [Luteolibacter sp.]
MNASSATPRRFCSTCLLGFALFSTAIEANPLGPELPTPAHESLPIDTFVMGDPASALQHNLASYNISKTDVYTGQGGLKALRLLQDEKNPYAGAYPGTYGGEITLTMKVDATAQNYFTGKFSGDETATGRILLVVNDKEIGSRHGSDEAYFEGMHGPVCPGAFYYRTAPIPRSLSDGKQEIAVRLRSTGLYYGYGKPHDYATYQRVMDRPSRGIYAVYTHTDPGALPDLGPIQGKTPSYENSPALASESLSALREKQIAEFDGQIKNLVSDKRIPGQNAAWNPLELAAKCYYRPEVKAAYQNPAVIKKICDVVDQLVRDDNEGKSKASGEWGGKYGRWADAYAIVAGEIGKNVLDAKVDLGKGEAPRREQWIRIFKESCDFGAANRRTISNQELFASLSVFGAALALDKLDPFKYKKQLDVAYHHVLQSTGIEEFTGNATIGPDGTPSLGNPKDAFTGPGYFFMTLKGTTHEPGWVSADCYGNLGNTIIEIYDMTKLYPGGIGDKRVLDRAVKHTTIQTHFTYAWNAEGNRAILADGFGCVRNQYVPGKIYYGAPEVAGASGDPTLMGYMRQAFEDGHLEPSNPKCGASVHSLEMFNNLIRQKEKYPTRVPSSPDQPDYFTADEENAIVTIKHGREQLFFNMFYRTAVDNKLVQLHHTSSAFEHFVELRPQHTEYRTEGKFETRSNKVTSWSGDAPDNPVSAYAGQKDLIPLGQRGILDLYQVRYGKYFVAMNCTRPGLDETVVFPKDLVGKQAFAMHLGKTITLPEKMSIAALTSYVFIFE